MYNYNYGSYLMHHGVKGMKWGVRRYEKANASRGSMEERFDSIRTQERDAHDDNRSNLRLHKKQYKRELKAQRRNKEITFREYRANKRAGYAAAKKMFQSNETKINKDFDKTYDKYISDGELHILKNRYYWRQSLVDLNNQVSLNRQTAAGSKFAYANSSYKGKTSYDYQKDIKKINEIQKRRSTYGLSR